MLVEPKLKPLVRQLGSAGLLALSLPFAAPALAQAQPAAPAAAASAPTAAAAPAAGASASANRVQTLDIITVTAQKVPEAAIKAPIALTAISGEDLKAAGINNAVDLAESVPNVWISVDTNKAQIAIRGVTNNDMTEKGDGSAAVHLDGVYISRPEAQLGGFFDLQRVEVLRGPQGTLYGRNATAGALNVITNKPSKKLEGKVGIELGNYGLLRTDGMVNVPISEMFQLRAAVTTAKRETYLLKGPNTSLELSSPDDIAGRLHLLTTFSKDTSLLLTAEHQHAGGIGPTPVPITNFFDGTPAGRLPFSPAGRGNNLLNPVYVDRGSDAQRTAAWEFATVWRPGSALAGQPVQAKTDQNIDILRGEFKTALGAGIDLNYQLAQVKLDGETISLGNFFGFPFLTRSLGNSKSTSHELRLSRAEGSLRWVAGAYLFDESIKRDTNFYTYVTLPNGNPLTVNLPFKPAVENKSKAVFGQATWSVLPGTRLVTGLRYTRDNKSGIDPLGGTAAAAGQTTSTAAYNKAVEYTNTSYRLGLDHDLTRNVMVYGSVATGYKSGGFNDKPTSPNYKPESLRAIELGVKGRFFDNRLQLTAGVFDYDYSDLQLGAVECPDGTPASCGAITKNAAKARIRGAEFEGWLNVGDSGRVNFGLALTDAKFKDYKPVDRPVNNPTLVVDWSGQRLDKAPPVTLNLGYTHVLPLASGADISMTVGTRYTGKYSISTSDENGIRYEQPGSRKSDLSVTYTSPSGKFSLQAYVKNIEDTITIGSRVPGSFTASDPRTFGVRGTLTF